jgi:alpha-aminoadipic semialdehyde synthase
VGAEIGEDLEECDVIIGVKEIPESSIIPKKTYMCFSHTHKGQPYNMPMLKRFLDSSCTLLDYECLTDEKGARLVAFGKFAGYAGMINCLHGMGLQFLARGYRTPLLVDIIPPLGETNP